MRNSIIKFTFLFFGLLFISCKDDSELIVGRYRSNDDVIGFSRTLKLFRDSTFMFSDSSLNRTFKRDTVIKGKYLIKKDTIYFQNSFYYFKKAILANGYFEMLSRSPLKFEIIKNNSEINSKIYIDNKSDFTFFTYTKEFFQKDLIGKNSSLNDVEILKVKNLIQATIEKNKDKFYSHLNEKDYYKQCMVVINSKGEKEISIDCLSKKSDFKSDWRHHFIHVMDGGDHFFWVKINLTKNEVLDLNVHGEA